MKLREFPVTTDIDRRRRQSKVKNPRAAVRNRFHRPLLEPLEVRLAPATINWVNPAGGDWDTASNWQGGVVPGANDDAVINEPGNVTITHSGSTGQRRKSDRVRSRHPVRWHAQCIRHFQ